MKYVIGIAAAFALCAGLFLLASVPRDLSVSNPVNPVFGMAAKTAAPVIFKDMDDPPQKPLADPPAIVKAVYLTGWSAGQENKMKEIEEMASDTEINAVVIDIKDYSGYLSYSVGIPLAQEIGADKEIRIKFPNRLIRDLHERGIYAIGRISTFQDPILGKGKPEWALHSGGILWKDRKGLAWMDPASEQVWNYDISIAKDALSRGFDEINFDYIRFPSDGDLEKIQYPFWDGKIPRHQVIKDFFKYVRMELPNARLSADLFGLSTVADGDMGIGQMIDDAYPYFDAVSPMVYPSHYAPGFIGYKNPADYPYEVVYYSMEGALRRLMADGKAQIPIEKKRLSSTSIDNASSGYEQSAASGTPSFRAKLRPWLQDFNLGADYNSAMVRAEIQAVSDALCGPETKFVSSTACGRANKFNGWMLWDAANVYTKGALRPK